MKSGVWGDGRFFIHFYRNTINNKRGRGGALRTKGESADYKGALHKMHPLHKSFYGQKEENGNF